MKKILLAIFLCAIFYAGHAFAAVNVNSASADELTQLPNIGPAKAQAIIKDREQNGDYESLADLSRVTGIGDKTVEDLRGEAAVAADTAAGSEE